MCMLCSSENKTRYIDLYIIGSEGLNVCHDCEMKLVEFCRNLKSTNHREYFEKQKQEKYWRDIGWKKWGIDLKWSDLIGERVLVEASQYSAHTFDRTVEKVYLDFVYFENDNTGYSQEILKLIKVYRSDKFPYGYEWYKSPINQENK